MISDTAFVGLRPTEDPAVWTLPVTPDLAGGRGQLFGGCGFGAAVEVLEHLVGRPAAWATAQFVSAARPPEVVRIEAASVATGRSFTQARVTGTVDDRPFLSVLAALGERPSDVEVRSLSMPEVGGPDDSEAHGFDPGESNLITRLDCRMARPGGADILADGTSCYWVRPDGMAAGSTIALTIVADLVPLALSDTIGRPMFGSSLDNTMRFTSRSTDEWVLAEMQVETIVDGVGHVGTRLWSPDGTLLATGAQTCAVSPR